MKLNKPMSPLLSSLFPSVRCQVMGPGISEAFKFPKLNRSNYAEWHTYCQSTLQSWHLWLIVTGDEEKPSKPAAIAAAGQEAKHAAAKKEWITWMKDDQATMGLMKKATSVKEVWDTWEKIHSKDQLLL